MYKLNCAVSTDLSGKEMHTEVSMVTSGSLGGVMLSTLTQNARDVSTVFKLPNLTQYLIFLI